MKVAEVIVKNIKRAKQLGKEESAIKILVSEYLKIQDSLYLHYDEDIDENVQVTIDKYLIDNIPVQYINGYTYFYGLKLIVNPDVLIPRFCTEILVQKAIEVIKDLPLKVIDIGCGSGAIAIAIKKHCPNALVTAVDISDEALDIAKQNSKNNNTDITFIKSDILSNVTGKFDIIVSNPPYIGNDDFVQDIVKDNEPHLALYANDNGLYFYKQIINQSNKILEESFTILFEIGSTQSTDIEKIAKDKYPSASVDTFNDMSSLPRVVKITKE